ncbi:MAG TPA: IPT/TIG domain-containing protein, partial [Candidatus Acidoferrales bacterium]|nr:IPT/TIG domain-containing protein [Candidatus Acidoferrales bacterium]
MLRFNLPPTVLALTLLLLLAACSGSKATGTGTGSGTPPNNGPAITELSPSTSTTGSAPQTLTIYGTNFLSTSTVTYNGVMHAATYVSAT